MDFEWDGDRWQLSKKPMTAADAQRFAVDNGVRLIDGHLLLDRDEGRCARLVAELGRRGLPTPIWLSVSPDLDPRGVLTLVARALGRGGCRDGDGPNRYVGYVRDPDEELHLLSTGAPDLDVWRVEVGSGGGVRGSGRSRGRGSRHRRLLRMLRPRRRG